MSVLSELLVPLDEISQAQMKTVHGIRIIALIIGLVYADASFCEREIGGRAVEDDVSRVGGEKDNSYLHWDVTAVRS